VPQTIEANDDQPMLPDSQDMSQDM